MLNEIESRVLAHHKINRIGVEEPQVADPKPSKDGADSSNEAAAATKNGTSSSRPRA